ncbi:hypothetical protein THF5H11_140044 [Vibrio jasicida]|uniref:hypothetical protein n=1 Tax=Vibrio jasicida TaxID=766224 RepID=UPI002894FB2A|nr:hypothetical protein THF5H11_140044 [Vibrio jasicida]
MNLLLPTAFFSYALLFIIIEWLEWEYGHTKGIYSRKIMGYEVFNDESQDGRAWVNRFVEWYNNEHKHRGLNYVTPSERHAGKDSEILQKRAAVLEVRRKQNPERWSGEIRNFPLVSMLKKHTNIALYTFPSYKENLTFTALVQNKPSKH